MEEDSKTYGDMVMVKLDRRPCVMSNSGDQTNGNGLVDIGRKKLRSTYRDAA